MEAAGIQVVLEQALPLSTLSYDSAARAVANSEADYLFFLADAGTSASMARSMADTGYKLEVRGVPHRLRLELHRAGRARRPRARSAGSARCPTRSAGRNAEQDAFLEWMDRTRPDSAATRFAADAWAASKAFFDALQALPGPDHPGGARRPAAGHGPTYDAGGFFGADPASGRSCSNGCFVAMIVRRRQVAAAHAGRRASSVDRSPLSRPSPARACTTSAPGYGRIEVLHGIDLAVRARRGRPRCSGPNGAGKTTALGVMSGLLDADARVPPRRGPPPQRRRRRRARPHRHLPHPRGPLGVPEPQRRRQPHRRGRRAGAPLDRLVEVAFTLFPRLARAPPAAGRHAVGRREADAGPGPRASAPTRRSCSSTSCRWAWPRWSSASSTRRSPTSPAPGVSVLVVEQFATIGLRYAVARLRDGPRRRHLRRAERRRAWTPSTPPTSGASRVTELLQFTLFGLMLGCVYAIAAMGLVLTYTVTGVFNFAHGAVGHARRLRLLRAPRRATACPTPIAVVARRARAARPLAGLVAERLLRRFQGADYATSLVVTVALTVGLLGLAQQVFDPGEARNVPYLFGDRRIALARRADHLRPHRPGRRSPSRVAFGLRFLLFGTPLGARMRAVVDDPRAGPPQRRAARSSSPGCSWMIGFVPGRARRRAVRRRRRTSTPSCSRCSCSTPTARRWSAGSPACR